MSYPIENVLNTIRKLERMGCAIAGTREERVPTIKIYPPPEGVFPTYGFMQQPPLAIPGPVECIAYLDGVRISWLAGGIEG